MGRETLVRVHAVERVDQHVCEASKPKLNARRPRNPYAAHEDRRHHCWHAPARVRRRGRPEALRGKRIIALSSAGLLLQQPHTLAAVTVQLAPRGAPDHAPCMCAGGRRS